MSETRYMVNKGFETAEKKMLEEMSEYAKEGWILSSMVPARFEFVKSAPQDIQYAVEYQPALANKRSYMESIKRSGWTYMCECEGFRIFSAPAGTRELSVDRTQLNKRIQAKKKKLLFMLLISIFIFVLDMIYGSSMGVGLSTLCAVCCAVLFGYSGGGLVGLRRKK